MYIFSQNQIRNMQEDNQEDFKRELGLLDGTMLVAGSMIGSGIFIVSSDMVRQLGSAGWLICYVGLWFAHSSCGC
jgi:amino acid transporter